MTSYHQYVCPSSCLPGCLVLALFDSNLLVLNDLDSTDLNRLAHLLDVSTPAPDHFLTQRGEDDRSCQRKKST